jgi:hypothetical protein
MKRCNRIDTAGMALCLAALLLPLAFAIPARAGQPPSQQVGQESQTWEQAVAHARQQQPLLAQASQLLELI